MRWVAHRELDLGCTMFTVMGSSQNVNSQNVNYLTVYGTWNGVMQDLEEMDNLDDFKTYFDS